MSSEQSDDYQFNSHVNSESMQAIPPLSFQSGIVNTASSIFISTSPPSLTEPQLPSSTSSIFGSNSEPSLNEFLGQEQARLVLFRVQSLEEKTDRIMHEMEQQRALLERIFKKRGWDADDEAEGEQRVEMSKKKKKSLEIRPLTTLPLNELTEEQKQTRKELLSHLDVQMIALAGLDASERFLPETAVPGVVNEKTIIPDFKKEVGDDTNKRLISQAALHVYKQQSDPILRELTYECVSFTSWDVDELAKEAFRSWKRKHEKQKDPEKKKKYEKTSKKAMRRQRKRQKKIDRGKAAKAYHEAQDIDTSPLLHTDWMSDYISDRSDLNEREKDDYTKAKLKMAGYSLAAKDVEVWETVRPAFRSEEVNKVYEMLDDIFADQQKKSRKKKPAVRRVDLGRMNYDIPTLAPFPFMIDSDWKSMFVDAKGLEGELEIRPEDPEKFGEKRRVVSANSV